MSASVKIFVLVVLFIVGLAAQSKDTKHDFVAVEKSQLAKLAARTDLTVKDFLQFVSEVDAKCTAATGAEKAEALCSLYYKLFKIEELFRDNPSGPTWEQCLRAGVTSDSLSNDDSVKAIVNTIAGKLCPKN